MPPSILRASRLSRQASPAMLAQPTATPTVAAERQRAKSAFDRRQDDDARCRRIRGSAFSYRARAPRRPPDAGNFTLTPGTAPPARCLLRHDKIQADDGRRARHFGHDEQATIRQRGACMAYTPSRTGIVLGARHRCCAGAASRRMYHRWSLCRWPCLMGLVGACEQHILR